MQVIIAVLKGIRPDRPADCGIYEELWELVSRCWLGDQAARPDMQDVSKEVCFSLICRAYLTLMRQA